MMRFTSIGFSFTEKPPTGFSPARLEQTREHRDRRALACPVRSQQAEHIAFFDIEADPLDCSEVVEILRQVLHFKNSCHPILQMRSRSGRERVGKWFNYSKKGHSVKRKQSV